MSDVTTPEDVDDDRADRDWHHYGEGHGIFRTPNAGGRIADGRDESVPAVAHCLFYSDDGLIPLGFEIDTDDGLYMSMEVDLTPEEAEGLARDLLLYAADVREEANDAD